jgi:hypothetical protein
MKDHGLLQFQKKNCKFKNYVNSSHPYIRRLKNATY